MNPKSRAGGIRGTFVGAVLGALMLLVTATSDARAAAKEKERCEICTEVFTNKIYVVEDRIRLVKKQVCRACTTSRTVCAACKLAAYPKTMLRLDDGRVLCELDRKGAVLDAEEATRIFHEVRREVQDILRHFGPIPMTNVTPYLVNQTDFNNEYQRKPSMDNPEDLLGLTRTVSTDGTNKAYHIYLLSGLLRPQFAAVCAHEYTHAWLNERASPTRTMNKDTVEGFCEFIAWKYVTARGQTQEVNRILENKYTRGQIDAMIAAERRYQFHRLIDWVDLGVDSWIDKDRIERVIELKDKPTEISTEPPLWQVATPRTAVPETLLLRGISGTSAKRFAIINDRTFEVGESNKVRIGTSNLLVRCLAIDTDTVTVECGEARERRTLKYSPKAGK